MIKQRGISLVESLVALALVGVAAIAIISGFMTLAYSNTRSGERTGAISAAETELEELRLQDPELMATSGSSTPKMIPVGDRQYEVVTHYCETTELCFDTTRELRVEVKLDGQPIYDVTTVYTQLR